MNFKNYYELTKPRLIYGNMVTTLGSFLYGLSGDLSLTKAIAACVGVGTIMGAGCVFNNLIDEDIDKLMERTKTRASARGLIDTDSGILFGTLLLATGIITLTLAKMGTALIFLMVGLFVYAGLYSLWYKRHSPHGTFVGAIAGAIPPLAGYVAASGKVDFQATTLFLILLFWQMPHAWSIAMYRKDDYAKAKIPVLPVIADAKTVKKQMFIYALLFGIAALLPYATGHANVFYGTVVLLLGAWWLYLIEYKLPATDEIATGRKLFRVSLIIIITIFVTLPLSAIK